MFNFCDCQVVDVTFGLFVWPCAPLLAKYVFFQRDFVSQKHILEVSLYCICLSDLAFGPLLLQQTLSLLTVTVI